MYFNGQSANGQSNLQNAINSSLSDVQTDINMNNYRITNCSDPADNQDVATKSYVLA